MRTSRKTLQDLTERLATITNLPLTLESHNPGDYRRYRVCTKVGDKGGVSERPFGWQSYRAGEMEIVLRAAFDGAEAMKYPKHI